VTASINKSIWTVYILKCVDGTYYTGVTNDLSKRIETHNSGLGAKYTRGRLPVILVYSEVHNNKKKAMSREWKLKRFTRWGKTELINKSNFKNHHLV